MFCIIEYDYYEFWSNGFCLSHLLELESFRFLFIIRYTSDSLIGYMYSSYTTLYTFSYKDFVRLFK